MVNVTLCGTIRHITVRYSDSSTSILSDRTIFFQQTDMQAKTLLILLVVVGLVMEAKAFWSRRRYYYSRRRRYDFKANEEREHGERRDSNEEGENGDPVSRPVKMPSLEPSDLWEHFLVGEQSPLSH